MDGDTMVLLLDRPEAGPALDRNPSDVAAWTLRQGNGLVTNWRAAGLEANLLIGAWAASAVVGGWGYADLLFSELATLGG